jgi:hypothetical protein
VAAITLSILALTLIVSVPPLLRWRDSFRAPLEHLGATIVAAGVLVTARVFLWFAPTDWGTEQIFNPATLGRPLAALLRSPLDFLFTMGLLAGIVALTFDLAEKLRLRVRHRHPPPSSGKEWTAFVAVQLACGSLVALLLVAYQGLLGSAIAATSVSALHFSLHPFSTARLAFAVALLLAQALMFWSAVCCVRLMIVPWRHPRVGGIAEVGFLLQAIPVVLIAVFPRLIGAAPSTIPPWPTVLAGLGCLLIARGISWVRPRYRHASQTLRLFAGALVLLIPAFVLYPSVLHFAERGLRRLIEEEYAQQASQQRAQLQQELSHVLQQIDQADIPDLRRTATVRRTVETDAAFQLWSQTDLATKRLAASLELYGPDGLLMSRFALNLPDYVSTGMRWREPSCQWEIFEEASPFGSEERRLIHAGRGLCLDNS